MTRALSSTALAHSRPAHSSQAGRPLQQQMPTERELNAAIARRHLEDLRAILGRDNEDIERLADLWPPVPRTTIEEELLGG